MEQGKRYIVITSSLSGKKYSVIDSENLQELMACDTMELCESYAKSLNTKHPSHK